MNATKLLQLNTRRIILVLLLSMLLVAGAYVAYAQITESDRGSAAQQRAQTANRNTPSENKLSAQVEVAASEAPTSGTQANTANQVNNRTSAVATTNSADTSNSDNSAADTQNQSNSSSNLAMQTNIMNDSDGAGENQSTQAQGAVNANAGFWTDYSKPDQAAIQAQLSDVAYNVTQEDGTERPHSSPLNANKEIGIYVDVLSGEPLFASDDKFESGTGWPSFTRPISEDAVVEKLDPGVFGIGDRTEIRSAIADNHLGHVFTDGPADSTGLRYCMNGAALEFVPKSEMEVRGYGAYLDEVES